MLWEKKKSFHLYSKVTITFRGKNKVHVTCITSWDVQLKNWNIQQAEKVESVKIKHFAIIKETNINNHCCLWTPTMVVFDHFAMECESAKTSLSGFATTKVTLPAFKLCHLCFNCFEIYHLDLVNFLLKNKFIQVYSSKTEACKKS